MTLPEVVLVTDGGCVTRTRSGGWAAILIAVADRMAEPIVPLINQQTGEPYITMLHGHVADTTVNQMEILAVLQGLRQLRRPTKVRVVSDSNLVVKTMAEGWKRDKNQTLWQALDQAIVAHDVRWEWTKGHAANYWNQRADALVAQERVTPGDTPHIDDVLAGVSR
jgi:ribonuclease HI